MASEIIGGAAEGGAAGYAVGGVYGAIAGAVVGGIGGLFGDKAKKARRQAARKEQEAALINVFVQRRAQLRQGQLLGAQALALGIATGADIESSGIQGVRASIQAQLEGQLKASDAIIGRKLRASQLERDAVGFEETQAMIEGLISAVGSASSLGGK